MPFKRRKEPEVSSSELLNALKQVESSGGKNLDHSEIDYGLHKGTTAYGNYGLMPNTSIEIANRALAAGVKDPALKELSELSPNQVNDFIAKTPFLEEILAKYAADRAVKRQGNNEEKAAYSWNQGLNLSPRDISEEDLANSAYIEKFRAVKDFLRKQQLEKSGLGPKPPFISPEFPPTPEDTKIFNSDADSLQKRRLP